MIFTVLVATLALPAMAAFNKVYYLGDYLIAKSVNAYDVTYAFQIPSIPTILMYSDGKLNSTGGSGKWYDAAPQNGIRHPEFRVYPIGEQIISEGNIPRNVIDITDFKPETMVSFATSFTIRFTFGYTQIAAGPGIMPISGYYNIYCYDSDGKHIATTSTAHFSADLNVPDASGYVDSNVGTVATYPFSSSESVLIPDDCAYIVPAIFFYFDNGDPSQPFYVNSCQPVFNNMTIRVKESSILVQSELMKDISAQLDDTNDQLGDLNDKADTIINGTDEQREHAQNVYDDIQDKDQDLSEALDDLEQYQDFDTGTVFGVINDFLEADGWFDIKHLLEPFLTWRHTATMMLFILAFSTLRVLLLGR